MEQVTDVFHFDNLSKNHDSKHNIDDQFLSDKLFPRPIIAGD